MTPHFPEDAMRAIDDMARQNAARNLLHDQAAEAQLRQLSETKKRNEMLVEQNEMLREQVSLLKEQAAGSEEARTKADKHARAMAWVGVVSLIFTAAGFVAALVFGLLQVT